MAVTKVVPLISAKIQRSWGQDKEVERLTKIMIAACEQSKNFVVPELCSPIKIQDLSNYIDANNSSIKAYFDPAGQNFLNLLQELHQEPKTDIVLLFGPEGGLTPEEEEIVAAAGFKTYALTPTILRSREAVIVGLGGVRSAAASLVRMDSAHPE
jgi:16S rRNA (uracil1498-N3)-methyltransferase